MSKVVRNELTDIDNVIGFFKRTQFEPYMHDKSVLSRKEIVELNIKDELQGPSFGCISYALYSNGEIRITGSHIDSSG